MPPTVRTPLTTTQRMCYRVHRLTANVRPPAHMTLSPRFADMHVLVIHVADLTDRRPARRRDHPHLTARQNQMSPLAFFRRQTR